MLIVASKAPTLTASFLRDSSSPSHRIITEMPGLPSSVKSMMMLMAFNSVREQSSKAASTIDVLLPAKNLWSHRSVCASNLSVRAIVDG
jgi:hypothetical protein